MRITMYSYSQSILKGNRPETFTISLLVRAARQGLSVVIAAISRGPALLLRKVNEKHPSVVAGIRLHWEALFHGFGN